MEKAEKQRMRRTYKERSGRERRKQLRSGEEGEKWAESTVTWVGKEATVRS